MQPREVVVFDTPHPCSYLTGRTARLPYRQPLEKLTPEEFDRRLAEGDRRSGVFLYRVQCPRCRACEAMRLDVSLFRPDATQRRMKRKGDALLRVEIGPPTVDRQRLRLFNMHRDGRGLAADDAALDEEGYAQFLSDTCCDTVELGYWHEDRLVGVAIADLGHEAMSAVYCYYDPGFRLLSLGTYSILREVELCLTTGRRYLYLGFYIAQSSHMSYKARFGPHERLVEGKWVSFD